MRADEAGRSVASRVLAILEVFEDNGPRLSLSQLSELSGLPVSTTHRIVMQLLEWGALSRDSQGRLQIGRRLWQLGQNADRRLRETARPFLQDLFSLTGETAHLAVREANEALYVDRIYGSKRVPRASRIGGRLPLHATAVGKVLLANEERWFRDAYLEGELEALTQFTHVDPQALSKELDQIVLQGYAIAKEEARVGACSIAVPMGNGVEFGDKSDGAQRIVGAAIGIVTLASHSQQLNRYLPPLQGVARRIHATIHSREPR